jgi:hypothetical protein
LRVIGCGERELRQVRRGKLGGVRGKATVWTCDGGAIGGVVGEGHSWGFALPRSLAVASS